MKSLEEQLESIALFEQTKRDQWMSRWMDEGVQNEIDEMEWSDEARDAITIAIHQGRFNA